MTRLDDDELAVPHFRDELWRELEKLHGAAGRTRRPRLLVAAAVVALGGGVGGVVLLGGRDEPATVTAPAGPSATTADDARDGATTGTTRPNGVVMTERRNAEGHVQRSWIDEETGVRRELSVGPDGRPRWDNGWLSIREEGGEVVIATRDVDHCFREYQDDELRMPAETFHEASPPDSWRVESVPDRMIDDGELVADGTEVVDGRELLRYQDVENDATVWLDPATRDVVKRRFSAGGDDEQSEAYEYTPRTPENLAVLEPEVPPGFTTPRADHTDEERAAAGCD